METFRIVCMKQCVSTTIRQRQPTVNSPTSSFGNGADFMEAIRRGCLRSEPPILAALLTIFLVVGCSPKAPTRPEVVRPAAPEPKLAPVEPEPELEAPAPVVRPFEPPVIDDDELDVPDFLK